MLKYLLLGSSLLLIAGCQTTSVLDKGYSPASNSRIRLYGQNQKPTILKYTYNGKSEKINVGGNAGDAFSSMIGIVKNQSIGIAPTNMSKNLKEHNGVISKIFYKEFVIPAGQPVFVQNSFIRLSNASQNATQTTVQYEGTCNSSGLTFTPKAGKDYEVIPAYNGSVCGLILLEINKNGDTTTVNLIK